ncbi:hypothetical protein SAMN05444166_2826 [Singulisphaera sp. GP187]|uniref:nuclear transport factor 2 family protein n=1 Tax=Singulisphaera sp. GP187 TaxID=1882752 RepID=UPI000928CA54|nr:nuclear transport factor 2 family protein [Singulisphaera sp. GP187]SIO17426.1 hypothetical protein SAMN05444166_2826 [Singulisphaera sp. GP187]
MSDAIVTAFIDRFPDAFSEGDPKVMDKKVEAGNVLVLQSLYRAIAQGNFTAFVNMLAEDVGIEILGTSTVPYLGSWQSRQKVAEAVRNNYAMVEEQQPVLQSVVAQGDTVVAAGCERGRNLVTGQRYDIQWVQFHTFRDGKLIRMRQLVTDTQS